MKTDVISKVSSHSEAIEWLKKRDWMAGIAGGLAATGALITALYKISH